MSDRQNTDELTSAELWFYLLSITVAGLAGLAIMLSSL
jgi:hypothetical protein